MFTRLSSGGTNPFERTYSYNGGNQVTQLVDKYNNDSPVSTAYSYDDLGQLLSEARPGYAVGYSGR